MANTQDQRLAAITTPLGKDVLLLEAFDGSEGVSELFRFDVRLLADVTRTIDFEAIVGKPVTIRLFTPSGDRFVNGFVSRFSEGRSDKTFTTYHAEVVPWLWMLTQTADCRIFQDKPVPDIITQIFTDLGFNDYALHLQRSYPPREYCVQYRETDFNFVSRLMEQYGIFYYFEHADGKHTLVLADSQAAHQPCPRQPKARLHTGAGTLTEHVVTDWRHEQSVRPGKYSLTDYNFEMPSVSLAVNVASAGGLSALEIYDYPGEYQKRADGEALVRTRAEEEECQRVLVGGASRCAGFTPGYKFDLLEHPRQSYNKPYVLTRVTHHGEEPGYRSDTAEFSYENTFTCIPAAVPFRPARRTASPVVEGVQTAEVVGVSGEEIYTDKYGRVKVQFHWDREGQKNEKSSCWVRVSHPWAGKSWGSVSIPRIGQEVIVDFLEGDPDQPIITGRVYNAEQMPPYALPSGGVVSGLKSSSTKGGGGYNEISMDDTKGKEKITVHGQYDMATTIEHDDAQTIRNDRSITVDGMHTEQIKKDTSITIIEGNLSQTVSAGTGTFKVKGAVSETFDDTQTTTVTKEIVIKSGTAHVHIAGETEVKLSSGAAFILIKKTGEIQIHGDKVEMIGKTESKIGVDTQSVTCTKQKVETSGAGITTSAVGVHEICGTLIKLN
jgi:type VI secretion system secreted protein VgrG